MTIFEEYRQKISGRGVGLLEFYLWIFCPLLGAYHIYNIIKYIIGKQPFETWGFLFSMFIASMAVLVAATGIFLTKTTFWIDIVLPAFYLLCSIIDIVKILIEAISLSLAGEGTFLSAFFGAIGILAFVGQFILMVIFATVFFYFIDHKDIYGY